jgi:hypothetical protein
MKSKVYISGPISKADDPERVFASWARHLKSMGYDAVNPYELGQNLKEELGREPTYDEYIANGLEALESCDHIYLLDGWENSDGARLEWDWAKKWGITPIYV